MEEIGRNDPCFCGSGKKYKKCCINKDGINVKEEIIKKREEKIIEFKTDERSEQEEITGMKCRKCGGELKKVEMVEYEDIMKFIESSRVIRNIDELIPEDLVIIKFDSKMGEIFEKPIKQKAYLRKVERKDKKGIKIKGLSKYFDTEKGEMKIIAKDPRFDTEVKYKIKIIDAEDMKIIKECIAKKEEYKLDKIVKRLTEKRKREEIGS